MSLNFNKLVVQGQNAAKEEQALKFLEFITEYTFKKNQYRTMNPNPILEKQYSQSEFNQKCDLMAELNAIDWKKEAKRLNEINESKASLGSELRLQSQQQQSQQEDNHSKKSKLNYSKNSGISIKSHSSILEQKQIPNLTKKQSGFKKNKDENKNSRISSISDNSSLNSDNFGSQHSQKYREDLEDFQSYISSIASQKKKTISVVNQVQYQDFDQIQSPVARKNISKISQKSHFFNNNQTQGENNSFIQLNDQQISDYLLKLQSFQIQQQMLVKRINKTLNKPLNCIRKMSNLKWSDLNMPKPSYKFMNLNYGQIIQ